MFSAIQVSGGITHITDAMGVSFTLIEGNKHAFLFDTGYGIEDVSEYVRTLTDKPVSVLLSHGHHDHILGARWLRDVRLCKEDMKEFIERTGESQRKKVKNQAESQGISVPPGFMSSEIPVPEEMEFTGKTGGFDSFMIDPGGLPAAVIRVPGHTPGSIVMYIPDRRLLLTADNWNPCTWMWFPSSLPATVWRDHMKTLICALEAETGTEIRSVLCSHQPMERSGQELKEYLDYMTDTQMKNAPYIDMGTSVNTHQVSNEKRGWTMIFDRDKI